MRSYFALVPAVGLLAGEVRADGPFGQPVVLEHKSDYAFVPPFTWTGFYFGGNIGGAWVGDLLRDSVSGVEFREDHSGFMGGLQLGYNYQIGNAVIGAEWDIDWMSIGTRGAATLAAPVGTLLGSASTRDVTTVAARVGVVGESWLAYLKFGGGWVSDHVTIANLTSGAVSTVSRDDGGWLIGGGAEYAITANWIAKAEFDYLGLPDRTVPGFGASDRLNGPHDFQMFKIGLSYKF